MGRKNDKSTSGSINSFTIRLPADCGSWMYRLAKETDKSLTELVVGFLNDVRTWWGLSPAVADAIEEDAKALSLSQRDYVLYLLANRFRLIKSKGVAFDKDSDEVLLSQRR